MKILFLLLVGVCLERSLGTSHLQDFEGLIMVTGGFNGKMFISSAESYMPAAHQWREEPSMKFSRGHSSSCVFNGKMWVLGGWNPYESTGAETTDSRALQSIEIFDTMRNVWIDGPDMISRRAFHKVATRSPLLYGDRFADFDLLSRSRLPSTATSTYSEGLTGTRISI
eukprot:746240-Hanusia_phi.AAC.3